MPNTIAENLQRLVDAKDDIAEAITAKGGTVAANDGLEEFAADIATIPSGGSSGVSKKDVNFYDYDDTIVQSYSADEFANLSESPANPTHEGLTAQGWNWSLADAKAHVAKYGKLNIGQMYVTSDGKTRIYITLTEGRTSPILQLYLNANSELDIDWGDGSAHSTFTTTSADYKSERHEYSASGDYVIVITAVSGGFVLQSSSTAVSNILWNGNNNSNSPDRAYNNSVQKIEIGTDVGSIGNNAFRSCFSLSSITIPNSVTSIGQSAFSGCYSLASIIIPNSVTSIDNSVFYYCYSLSSITVPNSVTSIGQSAFSGCYSLASIIIPNSVTSIGQSAISNCSSLSSITISDGVIGIGNYVFSGCYSLASIIIPNSVTNIGQSAFSNCSHMSYIKFESTSPPTVANSSAWQNVSTSTKILVPAGTLETYKAATNYPNPSTYTYEEY